jgi:hypothetical protein
MPDRPTFYVTEKRRKGVHQMRRLIAAVAALVALILGGGAGVSAW